MIHLNPFVENNKARINKFLNDLCEVTDFYESLELDQYMALSKKDLKLNITLNEIYNSHGLLQQHLDQLATTEQSHLRELLTELGPAPAQVPRSENRTIELPLYSRWETPIVDISQLDDGNALTQSDLLFMEAKSIFVHLIRSMPTMQSRRLPVQLPLIAEMAATSKDASLVKKGIKVTEMLKELEQMGVISSKDGYKLLTEEVKLELAHLGSLREKVREEYNSLQDVYKTICDHNEYLRSQLESYKAYLQNVRVQATGSGTSKPISTGKPKSQTLGPFKFSHAQLEKDGVIVDSNVPENRRANIFFNLTSPSPGAFVIALHYKGRDKAILEMDLKLDDLLEKVTLSFHIPKLILLAT